MRSGDKCIQCSLVLYIYICMCVWWDAFVTSPACVAERMRMKRRKRGCAREKGRKEREEIDTAHQHHIFSLILSSHSFSFSLPFSLSLPWPRSAFLFSHSFFFLCSTRTLFFFPPVPHLILYLPFFKHIFLFSLYPCSKKKTPTPYL